MKKNWELGGWEFIIWNWKRQEIINSVEVGNAKPNINRYLLSIYVESILKVFKHFSSTQVWSLGVGSWRFNISWSLI